MSNAKSEESIGIIGLEVPRHSLENDRVLSLYLLKTDRGLRKAKQLLCKPRNSISRLLTRPAMSTLLFPARGEQWRKGRAALRGVIPAIRQQWLEQFTTSLSCALQASPTALDQPSVSGGDAGAQEGRRCWLVSILSCKKSCWKRPFVARVRGTFFQSGSRSRGSPGAGTPSEALARRSV